MRSRVACFWLLSCSYTADPETPAECVGANPVADPYWDPTVGACRENAGHPTCTPVHLGTSSGPGEIPCTTHEPCPMYTMFCCEGYCRDPAEETLTLCIEETYLSGLPAALDGPPGFVLEYLTIGPDWEETASGRIGPSSPGCMVSWNHCFEVPATILLVVGKPTMRIAVGLLDEDLGEVVETRVKEVSALYREDVDRGCMGHVEHELGPGIDATVSTSFSLWYP